MSPSGERLSPALARRLAAEETHLVLVCGRYEGVDQRVADHLADLEVSIGDYVLTGGELPALVLIDAVTRFLPGVLGDADAPHKDSFSDGLLEAPHYTRPPVFRGHAVPDVLLSGNHAEIERWRREEGIRRTARKRPDLPLPEPPPAGKPRRKARPPEAPPVPPMPDGSGPSGE
jgi:tRNA (guanine37-N1)-methyltransferase